MQTQTSVTKADLHRIETSLKKVLKASQENRLEPAYLDLLNQIVDSLNHLRMTVEFDHEERLKAIEEFLQEI